MSIRPGDLVGLVKSADHPLGLKELQRAGGFHPGQQTELKRVLRELVRDGQLEKQGKRYIAPGARLPSAPPGAGAGKRTPVARKATGERSAVKAPARAPSRDAGRKPTSAGASGGRRTGFGARRGGRSEDAETVGPQVEGILHMHRDGFGFVHPMHGDGENIFLPPDQAARALDGDRVRVDVIGGSRGRTQGRLVDVTDRVRTRAVGVYRQAGRSAWVEPNDQGLQGDIQVPPTQLARPGDLVKVLLGIGNAVLEPGEGLYGEVLGSIGRPGQPSGEVLSIAYAQGFSDEFPDHVMAEADGVPPQVNAEELREEGRRDLRKLPLITIDGADARDFDDAVYAEPAGGGWRLVVAIADVSHYVREGNALDVEALHRGTSVYLPDRVLPMLPERLSNGICSLRPDEDRLCMVADMRLDAKANLVESDIYPAVMRSAARCTYEEVQAVLDGEDVPHRNVFRPHFELLMTVARALNAMRRARGALDFDLPEYKVMLDEEGIPLRLDKRERKDAHRLIEECMLAANEAVARFFRERELPSVYRFHGEPDEEKLEIFAALARAHGFELGGGKEISPHDLMRFLKQIEEHPERRVLNQLLLRSMMQAVYSAENVGHYGLGAEHYLHFTSPIRRYPDLLVHRLLKAHWARGGKVPPKRQREIEEERLEAMAVQSSERERAAVAVERETVSYYSALLVKDRVGESFDGIVAGVADFGVFVELQGVYVEGLVKSETVGFGAKFDQTLHALVFPDGRRIRVGDTMRVTISNVSVERRQIELEPEQDEARSTGPWRRRGKGEPVEEYRETRPPARGGRQGRGRAEAAGAAREDGPASGGRRGKGRTREEPVPATRGTATSARGREKTAGSDEAAPRERTARPAPSAAPGKSQEKSRRTREREAPLRTEAPPPAFGKVRERPQPPAQPWEHPATEEEADAREGSPHPGFDRLRALAAKRGQLGGGKAAKGARGGSRTAPTGRREEQPARDKFGNPITPKGKGGGRSKKPSGRGGGKGR